MRLGQPWSVERMGWEAVDPLTNVTILYLWKWSSYNIIFIIKKINVSEGVRV